MLSEDGKVAETTGQAASGETVPIEDSPIPTSEHLEPVQSEDCPIPASDFPETIQNEDSRVLKADLPEVVENEDTPIATSIMSGTADPLPASEGNKDVTPNAVAPDVPSTEEAEVEVTSETTSDTAVAEPKVQRLGFTLDIIDGKLDEYIEHHKNSRPEVVEALQSVGIRNLSLWAWQNRLFYYAEYVGTVPLAEAMDEYASKPGVKEWEELMHSYQAKIPGTDPSSESVWWQPCVQVYHQS